MSVNIQTIDYRYENVIYEITDEEGKTHRERNILIRAFGRIENPDDKHKLGESVCVDIDNFEACFYINKFENYEVIIENILDIIGFKEDIEIGEPFNARNFYGFCGDEYQKYIKISSKNYYILNNLSKILHNESINLYITNYNKKVLKDLINIDNQKKNIEDKLKQKNNKEKIKIVINIKNIISEDILPDNIKVFESNKDVLIQYFHERNLKPCGWIKIPKRGEQNYNETNCKKYYSVNWDEVEPIDNDEYNNIIQPFTLCAYDIECISEDNSFPLASRRTDEIVSIAATFNKIGQKCDYKCIVISKPCNKIKDVDVYVVKNERDLILKFCEIIREQDPDVCTNWNGFNFDDNYINDRSKMLGIDDQINFSRLNRKTNFIEKKLSSSAMGQNYLKYYDMEGRVNFDLMKNIQRDTTKLVSYKLDYVSSYYFRDQIINIENDYNKKICKITKKKKSDTFFKGQYTLFVRNDGTADYDLEDGYKFHILDILKDGLVMILKGNIDENILKEKGIIYACSVKDDVKPKEIFEKYKSGDPEKIKELSLYNVQDCELCNNLCNKLNILINNIGMSNVCYVPLNWIFNRGQSPKVFSVVSKKCKERNYLIPTMIRKTKDDEDELTFQGACVIPPTPGIYPIIFCLDYAALYPRSMICKNISHDMYVIDTPNMTKEEIMEKYKDKYTFEKIEYKPLNKEIEKEKHKAKNKGKFKSEVDDEDEDIITLDEYFKDFNENNKEVKSCYFARNKDKKTIGILPEVLLDILTNRANVRKKQKNFEAHSFQWNVLEGLQLAYKITCNSVYGQLGCEGVGPIAWMDLAACTTAVGRKMLLTAKTFATQIYPKVIQNALISKEHMKNYLLSIFEGHYREKDEPKFPLADKRLEKGDTKTLNELFDKTYKECLLLKDYNYDFKVAYGDTDSIFVAPNLRRKIDNSIVYGFELRDISIKLGLLGQIIVDKLLPPPEDLEYEKILSPFIILSKKRYVGNLYEEDPNKFYQKNMGIVLKRRDNAQIVKYVIGGLVDKLLNTIDQEKGKKLALEFVENALNDIINNKFKISLFVITKTLRDDYKNLSSNAHAVLAERIKQRDPGNAPSSNDRIPFVFIVKEKSKVKLQGDMIETPDYIIEHNLKIDYKAYITNQIQKPCQQFLDLFDPYKSKEIFIKAIRNANCAAEGVKLLSFDNIFNNDLDDIIINNDKNIKDKNDKDNKNKDNKDKDNKDKDNKDKEDKEDDKDNSDNNKNKKIKINNKNNIIDNNNDDDDDEIIDDDYFKSKKKSSSKKNPKSSLKKNLKSKK